MDADQPFRGNPACVVENGPVRAGIEVRRTFLRSTIIQRCAALSLSAAWSTRVPSLSTKVAIEKSQDRNDRPSIRKVPTAIPIR